ncbi:M48 family metallopeptidase [Pelistega suis]|uniref:M48 family metallopeptidase n=1 Tax=Pelistega suis TaxID=1631957 RepID=A0A849P363_9BURK|nr:M48 family metallopeptidase [Pelistega suis]NOL51486.1 M48 family metallopeptidase [Pelistega suis]
MTITSFTIIFIVLLVSQTLTQFYLSSRQVKAVSLHKDHVPLEFAHKISLTSHQRAAKYTIARQRLHLIEILVEVALLLGFTLFGGLTWLNNLLATHISSAIWYQIALVLSVFAISAIVSLPFSLYRTFGLEASFGFNRMTPALFVMDLIKSTLLSLVIMVPLLYGLFVFLDNFYSPNWWIWVWAGFVGITLLLMFIGPKFIMPLFNKFTPLDNPELQDRIQALAKRADFGLKELFVMDGSKRSSHGNAFFTGFGKNRRIVFFDTLLNKLNPSEIEAVLAHELGHFKHKHILKRMIMSFVMSFIFFAILGYLIDKTWFYAGLGVFPGINQPIFGMAIVLFSIVLPVFTFWYTPISSFLSRKDEFEADRYAASQSNANDLISALVKLYDDNAATLTPDNLHSAFYDSHPPASVRIQHLKMAS